MSRVYGNASNAFGRAAGYPRDRRQPLMFRAHRHNGTFFEFVEIGAIEFADIRDAEADHGEAFDAEAPGEDREFAAERQRDFGAEDAGAAHLDPFAARFHVDDDVDARLGVRVERRFELHAAEAHLRVELLQRAHQRREVRFFVDDDAVDLMEHGQVFEADRFVAVGPADAEELAGRVRVGGQCANRGGGGVRAEHDLLRALGAPGVAPAFAAGFPAVFVRAADRLDDLRGRQRRRRRMTHVERVLHLAGRVVLRLEEGVEVPERRLDHRRDDFGEAHLEERAAGLLDDLAERVDLGRVDVFGRELDVVGAEFDFAPGADSRSSGVRVLSLDNFAGHGNQKLSIPNPLGQSSAYSVS